ncbi:MAG: hypothetical protein JZD41_03030 [Thermoproteus sp.]|nr:hypothetical protein [Thermoproteus sp.]
MRAEVDGWTPYEVEAARPGGRTPPFPLALEPRGGPRGASRRPEDLRIVLPRGGVDLNKFKRID